MATIPDYLSVPEIADRLGVTQLTVRNWVSSGALPSAQVVAIASADSRRHAPRENPMLRQREASSRTDHRRFRVGRSSRPRSNRPIDVVETRSAGR
ncbi:MAG: helix-turn-helix domain-containing protein [Solirubrobacterales bacterium]